MRVTFNSFRDESLSSINREASNQARLQTQISSGQKISRADQDPQIAQKILALQTTSSQAQQFYDNAGYALDISRGSFSTVDEIRKVSDRVGELASAISPFTTPGSFEAYAEEVDSLIEQAVTAANQTFDGKYLLGGSKTDSAPFAITRDAGGQVNAVSYTGAAQGPAIQVSDSSTIAPFTDGATNEEIGDFINQLVALRGSLESGDATAVNAQRAGLQDAEDDVLGTLGRIGAQQRRLEISQETASERYDEASARISNYNDVDLSRAVVDLTKSQTAYQAALQVTAKIMSQSLLDYV